MLRYKGFGQSAQLVKTLMFSQISTWTPSFKFWPSKTHSFWSNTDNLSPRHPRKSQAKPLKVQGGPSNNLSILTFLISGMMMLRQRAVLCNPWQKWTWRGKSSWWSSLPSILLLWLPDPLSSTRTAKVTLITLGSRVKVPVLWKKSTKTRSGNSLRYR